jgi:RimJ/RimL family protein N-acetyltransferase
MSNGEVSLRAPAAGAVRLALAAAELTAHQVAWFERAASDDAIVYFAVSVKGRLGGQIMLHDIDRDGGVALVGYHIFRADDRGQGAGTATLALLCEYAFGELALRRLVAITGVANVASQRIAEKCGFTNKGKAREGAHLVVFERLR